MRQALIAALVAGACLAPVAARAQGQVKESNDRFDWTGQLEKGAWLRIRNLNGEIDVQPATGDQAEVIGEKRWRRGDPRDVRFQVFKGSDGVTICALWDEDDTCDERGYRSHGHHDRDRNDDVSVRFTVRLPRDVKVDVATVNGGVEVRGATSEVEAHTVNGRITAASTSGPVSASTVNGSLDVRMAELPGTDDLEFSTVNGSVSVEVPAALDADLEMSTVNGSLQTDFPLTVSGRIDPKHIRATVGKGGRRIKLETVNGSVELRKLS